MKNILGILILFLLLFSCSQKNTVQISGRVENGDSIVSIWVEDSVYTFPLDDDHFFTGKITLQHNVYATLLPYSLDIYLTPGEDVEIYLNAQNISGSLYFRGSLGGINSYLKEQELAEFFDKEYYKLPENLFLKKMRDLLNEKVQLLEAKNFGESFTKIEKQRIAYSVAERVAVYPFFQDRYLATGGYKPGKEFLDFMSSFPVNNEELSGSKDYRKFLLNYVYFQGSFNNAHGTSYSDGIVDYILSTLNNPAIKDFLLTEMIHRHIWENNGLNGADHLLTAFRKECSDPGKLAYIEEQVKHWEKLLPGRPAPDFKVQDVHGNDIRLSDYKGCYLYITVWATWCVPCKNELPYIELLQREYEGRNINFLTVSVDVSSQKEYWKEFLNHNSYAGTHTIADEKNGFNDKYMIISVPRFILIGADGNIINSNAPRPSGQIRQLFDELDL